MNIFFASAIRGGRAHQRECKKIVEFLQKYGTVSSDQIAEAELSSHGETEFTEEQIYKKELALLEVCDVVVAEISTPSLGVGYLLGKAETLGKKIFCLYHGEPLHALSAMIQGNRGITTIVYDTPEMLLGKFAEIFGNT